MTDWNQLREAADEVTPPPFETLVHTARRRDRRARTAGFVAALALVIGAGVGIGLGLRSDESDPQPVHDPTPSVVLPDGVRALPAGDETGALPAGRYRVPLDDSHAFDVDLRGGSDGHSGGIYISSEEIVLKTEVADDVYGVPTDACRGVTITPTGPTVDDLVQAIVAQRGLVVDGPEPATFEGATGQHLSIRIDPAFDVTGCRDHQVNLPGRYGTNNNVTPAYRGEWWILDAGGLRVVVQTMCDPCEAGATKRMRQTVGSISFTRTD